MHELRITKVLVEQIVNECNTNNIIEPKRVIVELGELTNYKKEPILYYYDFIRSQTHLLENTELVINEIKGKIRCNSCSKESEIKENYLILCPLCKSLDVHIIQGRDFILKEIEGE
ncbi:hydrogenase maturation nickel metallochaperone HypA [Candidatus Woesearchaeota archaeon]|nr:hydrogenase maturation nickel metallochaperone HypA [Candidatus Woesearchaeota archaeon]